MALRVEIDLLNERLWFARRLKHVTQFVGRLLRRHAVGRKKILAFGLHYNLLIGVQYFEVGVRALLHPLQFVMVLHEDELKYGHTPGDEDWQIERRPQQQALALRQRAEEVTDVSASAQEHQQNLCERDIETLANQPTISYDHSS